MAIHTVHDKSDCETMLYIRVTYDNVNVTVVWGYVNSYGVLLNHTDLLIILYVSVQTGFLHTHSEKSTEPR